MGGQINGRHQENKRRKNILGDINAKSPTWGSPTNYRRGEYWEELMSALNLNIMNDDMEPTFASRRTESYIDITCATSNIQKGISDWNGRSKTDPNTRRKFAEHEIKVYEGLLRDMLNREMEITVSLADRQFGFRKRRSTIQAVEMAINTVEHKPND
ncbi:hypothetical protein JTB14_007473 [Gonioctena quinquepunctata]|nr:hypothetical protein JTB14_007473 [Gonioctena quinquepunctata]